MLYVMLLIINYSVWWASCAFIIKCIERHGTEKLFSVSEPASDPLIHALLLGLSMMVFDIFI